MPAMATRWAVPRLAPPPSNLIRAYHLTSATHALNDIALRRLKIARISDLNDPFELMAVSLRERRMRDEVGALKFSYDSHTGLLCFSSDWTDPVLWSHYGDKHRGVCLGFNLVKNQAERVEYQDKRLLAQLPNDDSAGHITKGLEEQLLRTKFKHWEYESELRLCVRLQESLKEGSLYFQPFTDALCLAEVILGERCALHGESVRTYQCDTAHCSHV